jgi:DNA polymerase-3 subunit beta
LFDSTRLEGFVECVGTDGHHLSYLKTSFIGEKFKIIVSVENLRNITELINKDQEVIFYLQNKQLIIQIQQTLFNCRLIEGDYPSAIKAIEAPQQFQFSINKQELLNAIERGIVLASAEKKPSILCNITNNLIKISCRSIEYGSSYEEIPITNYTGSPINVSFNVKYLMDLIKNIDDSDVLFEFTESNKPFFIKDAKNPNYTSLILPIRII